SPVASGSNGPQWKTRIVGLEWLTTLLEAGAAIPNLDDFIAALRSSPQASEPLEPISVGVESSYNWRTTHIKELNVGGGLFKFVPSAALAGGSAEFAVNA